MKGCVVDNGYMGYVNGVYMLFADEADYKEYIREVTVQPICCIHKLQY